MPDGYEFLGSVTARERFAGTWERDVTVRLNWSEHPSRGEGLCCE